MDVKALINDMVKNGQSKESIVENLRELGIADPEKMYDDATQTFKEMELGKPAGSITPKQPVEQAAQPQQKEGMTEMLGEEPNALFGREKGEHSEESRKAMSDIPELEVTSVEGEKEKTVNIESMLRDGDSQEVMKSMPNTSFSTDEVERKLDETIALLKALQEINKKILESNKELLIKLK